MAENTTHTPGPWIYSEGSGCVKTSAAVPTIVVARYVDAHNGPAVSAAPELLAACLAVLGHLDGSTGEVDAVAILRAAIQKAEGR